MVLTNFAFLSVISRRAPKIGTKMKSLSLDCDAAYDKKASLSPVLSRRRLFKVRPLKQNSFDTPDDDELETLERLSGVYLTGGASCARPVACHIVAHEYRAKFPAELDLRYCFCATCFCQRPPPTTPRTQVDVSPLPFRHRIFSACWQTAEGTSFAKEGPNANSNSKCPLAVVDISHIASP
ncbi:unnamed protein product [Soboliphyme baturini]|uniref:Uncharacterized protein n=1 Tax=Soboliphyme baturini TaxID=241478 RepID=A0A183J980_9BILA|nr:unnamed protein product [Soboliphyme baturini]